MNKSVQILLAILLMGSLSALAQDAGGGQSPTANQFPKTLVKGLNVENATVYAPSISADGKTMVVESNKDGRWQLYISKKISDNEWSDMLPIEPINSFGDESDLIAGPNFSYDGNVLYFHASFDGGYGAEDIYYSVREGDTWSKPINIGPTINSSGHEGFPSISVDGRTLYFVRMAARQPENSRELCFTIYKSVKDDKGNWSTPEPLPYPVNQGRS
jgi:dipeptidyl aminopeptidase/acylaminoacyl peptidase